MDVKLLMVKTITIIYLSTKVNDTNHDIHNIVGDVLKAVKPPERSIQQEMTYDTANQLRECVIRMDDESKATSFNEDELRQRFQVITNNDKAIYKALVNMLIDGDDYDVDKTRDRLNSECWAIKRILDQEEVAKVARDWSMKLAWNPETVNWQTLVDDIRQDFEKFSSLNGTNKTIDTYAGVLSIIDFQDEQNVQDTLTRAKETWSSSGVLKCGYQGINRLCGEPGGFRRGEMLLIGALRHNYKSGFSRDLFATIPLFNKPYMFDPTKKPLNLRFSFEDSASDDIIDIYRRLLQNLEGRSVKTKDIDVIEASKYVKEQLGRNGYENIILSIDPGMFSLDAIVNAIEYYENKGYEIHHLNIDYLAMLTKNDNGKSDALTQVILNLFTQLRNVCRRKNIFISTPHQLGADAKNIIRDGGTDFVKKVAGKSFYDSCKRIDQEVDLEITLHIEKVNDDKFLTFIRGKHRGVNNTPFVDQYGAYLFDPELGLPWDVEGVDLSRRKVGGETVANGGAGPLWDVE